MVLNYILVGCPRTLSVTTYQSTQIFLVKDPQFNGISHRPPATSKLFLSWRFYNFPWFLFFGKPHGLISSFAVCTTTPHSVRRTFTDSMHLHISVLRICMQYILLFENHIMTHKQTRLQSKTDWKLLLYFDFCSYFEATSPNCFKCFL